MATEDDELPVELDRTDNASLISWEEADIEQAYLQALKASEEAGLVPAAYLPDSEILSTNYVAFENNLPSAAAESVDEQEVPPEAQDNSVGRQDVSPEQILEALLFVGGEKLTAKKMASLLGQHCTDEQVHRWIENLNQRYREQNRPYEILLGEDGYKMTLLPAFQQQREYLFGVRPREVKLSQEVLEVLAFVAYQQPVSLAAIEEIDRQNTQSSLRQLIRRELVAVHKNDTGVAVYQTTDRFLQLFGLTHLSELPRSRDLAQK